MKSIIISHKELQTALFNAITYGFQQIPGYSIYGLPLQSHFQWKLYRQDTNWNDEKLPLIDFQFHKEEYRMMSIDLNVVVYYLNERAQEFMSEVKKVVGYTIIGGGLSPEGFIPMQDKAHNGKWATWLGIPGEYESGYEKSELVIFGDSPADSAQKFMSVLHDKTAHKESIQYRILKV